MTGRHEDIDLAIGNSTLVAIAPRESSRYTAKLYPRKIVPSREASWLPRWNLDGNLWQPKGGIRVYIILLPHEKEHVAIS